MPTSDHTCPRCAYDLSGVIESWQDACPLTGTCSECGLSFTWFDVLRGPLRFPDWSFEHALGRRVFATYFPTLLRTFRPRRLWQDIRLETRSNPRRLLLFVVLTFILLRLIGIVCIGIPATAAFVSIQSQWTGSCDLTHNAILLAWPYSGDYWGILELLFAPWVAMALLAVGLVPLAFAALPVSLRRAKVRPLHLVRVQLYTLALLPILLGSWPVVRRVYTLLNLLAPSVTEALGMGWLDETTPKLGLLSMAWTTVITLYLWRTAARDYLRLERPTAVALATTTIATLAAAVLVVLAYGPAVVL